MGKCVGSIKGVAPISETIHQKARNAYRKSVNNRYEDGRHYMSIYPSNRYKAKQLFGNVKGVWDDRDRTKKY